MSIEELLEAANKVVVSDKKIEELSSRLKTAEQGYEEEKLARSASSEFMSRTYCL